MTTKIDGRGARKRVPRVEAISGKARNKAKPQEEAEKSGYGLFPPEEKTENRLQ